MIGTWIPFVFLASFKRTFPEVNKYTLNYESRLPHTHTHTHMYPKRRDDHHQIEKILSPTKQTLNITTRKNK